MKDGNRDKKTEGMNKWDGQISEEAHIAIHYAKYTSQIDALQKRIKEYGDRRAAEVQERFDRYVELDKLQSSIMGIEEKGLAVSKTETK